MRALLWACVVLVASCAAPRVEVAAPTPTAASAAAESAAPSPTSVPETPAETPQPTPSPTPIALPRCGVPFSAVNEDRQVCPLGAHISIDYRISDADAAAITAQVIEDLAAVQQEFEWTLRGTARIDVYSTTELYSSGLRLVFGYSKATADYLAENSVAFFEPSQARIAVNWAEISARRPIAAIRHELTHIVTLEACAPRCDLVPAWFNEGQARLAEATIPGADWRMMRVRYEAASMVTTDTLLPLNSLWTQSQWNAFGDWAGYYKYQEAARATELLRTDIGERAIPKIYERMRRGQDVPSAYAALSGRSWSSFVAGLPARLSEGVSSYGIATTTPAAEGQGVAFLLYGFASEAKVALTIKGRHYDETSEVSVSPQGAYFGSLDDSFAPGRYTITAANGSSDAAVTVVKRGGRVLQQQSD